MRVFTWIVRTIVAGAVLMCVIMIGLAPQTVVTHFNSAGLADSFGSRWWLVMLPLLVVVTGEVMIKLARQKWRKLGLLQLPTLTGFEGQCLGAMVGFSVLLWVILQSEVQGRLVSGGIGGW
ncbi:DUF1648 domain-containing protein [Lactiplantibacillus plantarum]|uniref:DUF1648 domain-containing protein n=1 Tax=Lactiplantibacillus plantarum TaxID=1590 RepID=UPI0011CC376A|nr:DUF1648 domain-containing protein [Lactiplantibacillus plantarum]TXJ68907.1 DUF1648 domain-containing protein [Lactiplantibacillus plantarum]TXJ72596.1 DUF1648 domain-containing protein [Lactiplantibacillus plantarum]TXJ96249.1 DUF1648 domain-containing protein [Lactiplantibacillus plantarum]